MAFRDDRDALRARNEALEKELVDVKRALAEKESDARAPRRRAERPLPSSASGQKDLAAIEAKRAASASTKLVPRVLSVFARAWVVVVFWLPALLAVFVLVNLPEARLPVAAGLVAHATLVVCIDALLRRCPSCRRLLAGHMLSLVRDQYDFHVRTWKCVHCHHRWKTQSIATTSRA